MSGSVDNLKAPAQKTNIAAPDSYKKSPLLNHRLSSRPRFSRLSFTGRGLAAILLPILLIGSLLALFILRPHSPFPPQVQRDTSFPLYYPSKFPAGFKLDRGSISASGGIVIFAISDGRGRQIAVTEQARPQNFDFSSLRGEAFITRVGKATLAVQEERTSASLLADQTWILIRTPFPVATSDLKALVDGFKPAGN